MGKNLVAISEITSAKKAKYVTPSMMIVEGEMECIIMTSPGGGQPGGTATPPSEIPNGGGDEDDLSSPASFRLLY